MQIIVYVAAILLMIGLAVYGIIEQSSLADALVDSFVE